MYKSPPSGVRDEEARLRLRDLGLRIATGFKLEFLVFKVQVVACSMG